MGQDENGLVSVRAVLLKEFDLQKVYGVATNTARAAMCTFEGISLYELPTTPPGLADSVTFTASEGSVDDVVRNLLEGLEADRSSVRFTVSPLDNRVPAPSGWKQVRPRGKAGRYVRTNWGSPFIVAFILLLAGSAVELSAGLSGIANILAVYAFYALVLGIALQIVSSAKYEANPLSNAAPEGNNAPMRRLRPRRRILLMAVLAGTLIVASVLTASAVDLQSGTPSGCNGARTDGTVFISSTQTVSIEICGQTLVVEAGTGGGLVYPYHSGTVRLSAPASVNGSEFKSWYAVLGGNPQKPVANNTLDLTLPRGLSAQSSSIEVFYSAPASSIVSAAATPASSSTSVSSISASVHALTSSATSSTSESISATSSSMSSSSTTGCQGSDGQVFLSTNVDEVVQVLVCGQRVQVRGGTGQGVDFGYHAGQMMLDAPQTIGGATFEYWYIAFPALHEQIVSNSAVFQVPAGLTAAGAIIMAFYG